MLGLPSLDSGPALQPRARLADACGRSRSTTRRRSTPTSSPPPRSPPRRTGTSSTPTRPADARESAAAGSASAGADEPLAQFSYALLRPRGSGPVRLRIEEAGAEQAQYDVLVNGVKIHHRGPNPQERGQYGGQVGLVHYELTIPRAALDKRRGAERFRLTFRNARRARPRRADRAGVGDRRQGRPRRARRRRSRRALRRHRRQRRARCRRPRHDDRCAATSSARPYAIVDFGKEVGGDVTVRAKKLSGSPKVSFAFSESKQFMTSASDYSADPVGVVTETETVKVPNGTTHDLAARRPRRLPLPDGVAERPRRRRAVRPEAEIRGGAAAERPARLPRRLPQLRRPAQPLLVLRRLHGPALDDRPADRPPLPGAARPAAQRRENRRRPLRDRRRAEARPLHLGRRPRRRQPGRVPVDRRHAQPPARLRLAVGQTERRGPAGRRLHPGGGRQRLVDELGRVRALVDRQLRAALPLQRRQSVLRQMVPAVAGDGRLGARTSIPPTTCW